MMKIVASLVILGLCVNVCFGTGVAPISSSQSSAFSTSVLNSTITQVLKGSNSTDSANWDSSVAAATGPPVVTALSAGVYSSATWFGPGATNDTSYLWGIPSSGYTQSSASTVTTATGGSIYAYTTSAIRKRTINNTIVGWQNDTSEASVVGDTSITTSFMGNLRSAAVGPGYLAILTSGFDGITTPNNQVWITLVSGTAGSASTTKLTSTADVYSAASTTSTGGGCTATTFSLGNVWYDIGSAAFFYTYSKNVITYGADSSATTCNTAAASIVSTTTNIYLGGIYVNGTAYWTSPITASAATAGNTISVIMGGGDNWLNSSNIYIAYKDYTAGITYSSKTTKASTTTAIASFSSLIKDTTSGTTTTVDMTYSPASVWASNFTYGITVSNSTTTEVVATTTYTYNYGFTNFLNGSATGVDSGLSSSGSGGTGGFWGWQLNTGYSILAGFSSSTSPYPTTYTLATYYGNGTANSTAMTAGTLTYGSPQLYEDVNGTFWIGWTDVDTANTPTWTYSAYLAKFQGQLNVPSGASVLSALSVFALFLVSIFAF